jgi:U3 small nucleolar RNA-associated protein 20
MADLYVRLHPTTSIHSLQLLAQLKVNLRPLWPPTAEALARLAGSYGERVWALIFSELQILVHPVPLDIPTWLSGSYEDEDQDGIHEEERSWRDPTAHKLLCITGGWRRDDARTVEVIQVIISPVCL